MENNTINILIIEDEDYDVRRIRNTLKLFEHKILIKGGKTNWPERLNFKLYIIY